MKKCQPPEKNPWDREGASGPLIPLIRSVAVILASLIAALLFSEAVLRIAYPLIEDYDTEMWRYSTEMKEQFFRPELPFHHFPNRSGSYYGVEIATNSFGFRDREFALEKAEGTTRIIVLGDSMTLGWGVPVEATFSKVLEQELARVGEPAEVINLGIGNYNTRMEVELMKLKGIQFQPDILVLCYYVNDAEPVPRVSRLRHFMMSRSYMLGFIFRTYVHVKARLNLDPEFTWQSYYTTLYSEASPGLRDTASAVRELAELCAAKNISLLVVNIPELRQVDDYPISIATRHIEGLAKGNGLPFSDLLPLFQGHAQESLWVSAEDPHANAKAHKLIAQGILDALRSSRMLPRSRSGDTAPLLAPG